MGILAWIVFGLIAGVIAKFIMPGRDGGGFILTCVLGIVGAVVGGWLATMFGYGGDITGFDMHSFIVAVIGAIVVLAGFRLLRRERVFPEKKAPRYAGLFFSLMAGSFKPLPAPQKGSHLVFRLLLLKKKKQETNIYISQIQVYQ